MKIKKIKLKLLLLFFIVLFIYSTLNIFFWFKDSSSIARESENLLEAINNQFIQTIESNEINSTSNNTQSSSINFSELESINSDVVGWIQVNGTDINYPFVQTDDNSYYLTHSYSKDYNKSGWIFLDYRNNIYNFDKNTIIYGHSRYDSSMFGSLRNTLKKNWLNNEDNHKIYLSTKYGNTLWQVFSVYHLPNTNDYLATEFNDNEEFKNFIKLIKNRSIYNFNINVTENDKIITLSTCYRTDERMVMHAKLLEEQ